MSLQVRNDEVRELRALQHIVQSAVNATTSTTVALQAAASVLNAALASAQAAASTAETARKSIEELVRLYDKRTATLDDERSNAEDAEKAKRVTGSKRQRAAARRETGPRKRAKSTKMVLEQPLVGEPAATALTLPLRVSRGLLLCSIGAPVYDRPAFRAHSAQFDYIYNDGYRVVRTLSGDTEIVLEICDRGGDAPVFVLTASDFPPFTGATATQVWDEYQRAVAPDNLRRVSGPALFGLKNERIADLLRASVQDGLCGGAAAVASQ